MKQEAALMLTLVVMAPPHIFHIWMRFAKRCAMALVIWHVESHGRRISRCRQQKQIYPQIYSKPLNSDQLQKQGTVTANDGLIFSLENQVKNIRLYVLGVPLFSIHYRQKRGAAL